MVRRNYIFFVIILCALVIYYNPVAAQKSTPGTQDQLLVPETGHTISGDFLATYLKAPNPQIVFGNPITEPFISKYSNRIVQYFEYTRFELLPENPTEIRVRITPLGEILYERGESLPVPENYPACQEFKETKYRICFSFLEFFQANGGISIFGYPVSDFEIRDDLIVQNFQNGRMEWHPENPPGHRVLLTPLGRYFFNKYEDSRLLKPPLNNNLTQNIININARAFVDKVVLPFSGTQTLFIIVQNQNHQPVSDAQAYIYITYPYEAVPQQYVSNPSDANGIIALPFSYTNKHPGIVNIKITINYPSLPEFETVSSFRIWW